MKISAVIPVLNEAENISELFCSIKNVFDFQKYDYEIIFVDDGSTDESYEILKKISLAETKVKVISFTRNYGQTAAISAGFKKAQGDIIVTLDADLQNNPEDIPSLIDSLIKNKAAVVSGWRYDRKDSFARTFVSKIANYIISRICGLELHDFGCTLKAYKSEFVKNIDLYGEM